MQCIHISQGYRQQRAYVIAQSPMQSTLREFWKIVYDRRCGIIVMLNKPIESGKVLLCITTLHWYIYKLYFYPFRRCVTSTGPLLIVWRLMSSLLPSWVRRSCLDSHYVHSVSSTGRWVNNPVYMCVYSSLMSVQYPTSHQVSQIHITTWKPDGFCSNFSSITDAIAEMSKIQRKTGNHPILIHCRFGDCNTNVHFSVLTRGTCVYSEM